MKIDKEFQAILPPLDPEEYTHLKKRILEEGCLDALKVWDGISIDGHNRYAICTENNIPFNTIEMKFKNREEAKLWIVSTQLARRNVSAGKRVELALMFEESVKARAKEHQKLSEGRGQKGSQKSDDLKPIRTDEELAKIADVSRDTLRKGKKILEEGTDEQKERMRQGGKGNTISAIHDEIKKSKEEMSVEGPPEGIPRDVFVKEKPKRRIKDPYDHPLYDLSTVPEYSIDMLIGEMEATEETVLYWVNAWRKDGDKFLHIKENAERFNKALDNLINILKERKIYETTN